MCARRGAVAASLTEHEFNARFEVTRPFAKQRRNNNCSGYHDCAVSFSAFLLEWSKYRAQDVRDSPKRGPCHKLAPEPSIQRPGLGKCIDLWRDQKAPSQQAVLLAAYASARTQPRLESQARLTFNAGWQTAEVSERGGLSGFSVSFAASQRAKDRNRLPLSASRLQRPCKAS